MIALREHDDGDKYWSGRLNARWCCEDMKFERLKTAGVEAQEKLLIVKSQGEVWGLYRAFKLLWNGIAKGWMFVAEGRRCSIKFKAFRVRPWRFLFSLYCTVLLESVFSTSEDKSHRTKSDKHTSNRLRLPHQLNDIQICMYTSNHHHQSDLIGLSLYLCFRRIMWWTWSHVNSDHIDDLGVNMC